MSEYVSNFCKKYGIDPEHRDLASLQHMADVCKTVISQDLIYACDTFSDKAFDDYLALIKSYAEDFLPHATINSQRIPALKNLSALQYAALNGFDRYIEGLPNVPVDAINAQNMFGMSALHLAATNSHLACCKALCERGATVTLENNQKQLPLYCVLTDPERPTAATAARQAEVFRYLWQRDPETIKHLDLIHQNVAHLMAIYGHTDLLEEALLQDRSLVLNRNNHGSAPIHAAIDNQQFLAVQTILTTVPEAIKLAGHKSRLPVHCAALAGDDEILRYCCNINHERDVINAYDDDHKTPWMLASEAGEEGALHILSEYSAEKPPNYRK